MISYVNYLYIILSIFFVFNYSKIKKITDKKYKRLKKLRRMVSTTYKGFLMIWWITFYLLCKAFWINIHQYFYKTLCYLDKDKYIITYYIEGNIYKMVIKVKRGPRKVLLVLDENDEDVSHEILPYLGPLENFHLNSFTPSFFNKKELTFELSNGRELSFKENDLINLD